MKNQFAIVLLFFVVYSYGQVDLAEDFKKLYSEEKYSEIINYKPDKNRDLTAKALYYKGMSHYMLSEDKAALKYLDQAIKKGPIDHDMYYYKGMIYFYAGKYSESLVYFDKAIALLSNEPDFYGSKGESFYHLNQMDSAIYNFEKAANLPGCKPRVLILMGEIYQEQNKIEHALISFQKALEQLTINDDNYQNCSFNVGLMQQLSGKSSEAKETLEKHITIYPSDFHAMAKLIQVYYSLSEFRKAIPYKAKLYAAHKENKLQEEMKEMFCFDQFLWKDKRIMAFENFEESDETMFVKHHFYVLNEDGEIEYWIDSESSIAIRMHDSDNKYVLCLVKDRAHFTYWHYLFNDDYEYPELKTAVLDILNGEVTPGGAFIPGTEKHD